MSQNDPLLGYKILLVTSSGLGSHSVSSGI